MKPVPLFLTLAAAFLNDPLLLALDITAQGPAVGVASGSARIGSKTATVMRPATLPIAAASIITVTDEPVKLSVDKPVGWSKGTRLRGCKAPADASARWEHLAKEGLPYLTLLDNTINHPDDRGHRLFAEELWGCFR